MTKESIKPTKKETAKIKKALKEASQPIAFKDKDFKLGAGELDIRELNDSNFKQVIFRLLADNLSYQRSMHQDLVDIMRLVMICCKKLGVEDIIKETEEMQNELASKIK